MPDTDRPLRAKAQARRDALLSATVAVAAESGYAGITHRAVTEKAGLPLATVSYFFSSIDDLAREAIRVAMAADVEQQLALATRLAAEHRSPDEIAAAFTATAAPRRPDSIALFEAFLTAARNPEHQAESGAAIDSAREVAAAALRAAGAPEPDRIVAAFAALTHGLALHELAAPDRVGPADRHRAFRALFLGFLVEQGRIDEASQLAAVFAETS